MLELAGELKEVLSGANAASSEYLRQLLPVIEAQGAAVTAALDCHGRAALHYAVSLPDDIATAHILSMTMGTDDPTATATALALPDPEVRRTSRSSREAASRCRTTSEAWDVPLMDGPSRGAVGWSLHGPRRQQGKTPLHLAASTGSLRSMRWLLAAGADPAARDTAGLSPLHSAALAGNGAAVALLIQGGADANARDRRGMHARVRAENTQEPSLTPAVAASGACRSVCGRQDEPLCS